MMDTRWRCQAMDHSSSMERAIALAKFAPGGLFPKNRTLWKGKAGVKLDEEYRGAKSIVDWLDETKLRPIYERNKEEATRIIFQRNLMPILLSPTWDRHTSLGIRSVIAANYLMPTLV